MIDMQPQPDQYSIQLPITFDYKGGRGENKKNIIILGIIIAVLVVLGIIGVSTNAGLELWQKALYDFAVFYVGLLIMRYVVLNELYFSDLYEGLLERDFELSVLDIWQIFDIDTRYPHICYYKNGTKGIFVRMEKDVVTGKPDTIMYDHYEAISDAYNLAHSLNMNIIHIDYMDNVGNDIRLQNLYNSLVEVKNPDMHEILVDIYDYLSLEMSHCYSSFDVYLFLTRDNVENFVYNVRNVAGTMLGGNFITYKILSRPEISVICKALFNIYEFSIVDACTSVVTGRTRNEIIPINIRHADGTVTVLNKTQKELEVEEEMENRRSEDERNEHLKSRHANRRKKREEKRKKKRGEQTVEEENLDLFNDDNNFDLFS